MNQNYKVNIHHFITKMKRNGNNERIDPRAVQEFALEQIHKIDYLQPWGNPQSDFTIEKSFTWLDWLIMNDVIGAKKTGGAIN